jgi:hypothetical protein
VESVEGEEAIGAEEGVGGGVERVIRGIKVRLLSRLLLSMRLCNGWRTPFSCEGGITTPVLVCGGGKRGAGRRFVPWGVIRVGWRVVGPPTDGVLAQSVNGIPISLVGASAGTVVPGLGGAGRSEGGLLDGDAVIWFLSGLP